MFKIRKIAGLGLLATLAPFSAMAQEVYGAGDLSFIADGFDVNSNTGTSGPRSEVGLGLAGYVGYRFESGYFVEGDLRFMNLQTDNGFEGLESSAAAFLRAGLERGAWTGEIIIGYADVTTNNGQGQAVTGGIGGSYAVSDKLKLRGLVSLTGEPTGDNGENVPDRATAVSLGALYDISDRSSVWGDVTYLDGEMDDDADNLYITEVSVGMSYDLAVPGLSAYGTLSYTDAFQGDEDDAVYATQLGLGLTYSFGAAGNRDVHKRAPMNLENWMALTGGILE